MPNKLLTYIGIFFKGIAMGCADVVPGVSGGTIALITGIYDRLIFSIRSFNLVAIKLLLAFELKALWKHIDGTFLVSLVLGIGISLYSLASLITYLISDFPIQLWSFFFGLIIISAIFVLRELKKGDFINILLVIIGAVIAFFVTSAPVMQASSSIWILFPVGAIAICAMILPGLSGAFLLLIMGQYDNVLSALKNLEFSKISIFAAGCLVGLLSFSRLIAYLLANFRDKTIAILAGFMIGALNEIWPWKIVTQYRLNSKGEQVPFLKENVMPNTFVEKTNATDPYLLEAILFMALGIFLIVAIERVGKYIQDRDKI